MRYAASTSKGMVRKVNEDSYAIVENLTGDCMAFAVADGMGGHDFGDIASSMAADLFKEFFLDSQMEDGDFQPFEEQLQYIFRDINQKIYKMGLEKNSNLGMGTTFSTVIVNNNQIYLGHVGDSRVYIIKNDTITQLTKDHSYVEQLLSMGMITKEEAINHPDKNVITRALGLRAEVRVDIIKEEFNAGDILLLCSDGLTNVLLDDKILEIIKEYKTPEECTEKLIEIANELGGPDNITAIMILNDR